ncbi:unnamed protein product [Trichobilharzia szidati]|nr:unnamed protein product [Trichobilharzia szidati]
MIRQFQNEKRICQMKCDKLQSQLNTVENLLNTTHLTVKNTLIALKKVEAEKQELLVTLNLNKFQVRRMDNKLKMLRDSIMNSETRQLQMDALEREIEAEINMRKTNLLSELHLLNANLEEIRKDFNKRQARLCHVKSRYEVMLITLGKNVENEVGCRMRYILEALSQRQELRQKGDDLDIEVRTAEEELRALENTVLVMNSLNEMARIALPKNVPEESMIEEEKKLKELLKQAETQWQQIREERRKRRAAIMNLELQRQEINESLNLSTERVRSASACIEKALKSLSDIQERNKRSKKLYHKAIQSLGKPTPEIRLDVDIEVENHLNLKACHYQ